MSNPEPRLLLVETSGRTGQVGVAQGPRLLGLRRLEESRRHARDLAPAVADLLAQVGWKPRDVQSVIVSRGPGSYTGLRVGIMSAKAFAYATGCALIGIETFEVLAAQAPPEAEAVYVLADAQQDHLYVQKFGRATPRGCWSAVSELAILPAGEWLAQREDAVWLTGPGLAVVADRLPQNSRVVDPARWEPTVESLFALGLARYQTGRLDDFRTLEPLYARRSSAEEKWKSAGPAPSASEG